eukprot:3935910-Rhodomonas_salina.3
MELLEVQTLSRCTRYGMRDAVIAMTLLQRMCSAVWRTEMEHGGARMGRRVRWSWRICRG